MVQWLQVGSKTTVHGITSNSNGAMATGWLQYNGSWYYLNANGAMATGWAKVNGSRYYLNANGAMATGWLQYNDSWYYLNANGAMRMIPIQRLMVLPQR